MSNLLGNVMVFIPRKMSDELIARFRVGCPILLKYTQFDGPSYTIIELSTKHEPFPCEGLNFVYDENIKVSTPGNSLLGETIYNIQDSEGLHSRISWKISLETFEKVCQCLKKN